MKLEKFLIRDFTNPDHVNSESYFITVPEGSLFLKCLEDSQGIFAWYHVPDNFDIKSETYTMPMKKEEFYMPRLNTTIREGYTFIQIMSFFVQPNPEKPDQIQVAFFIYKKD